MRLSGEIADDAVLAGLRALFPNARVEHAYASTEAGVAFAVADGRAGFPAALIGEDGEVAMKVVDGSLRVRSNRAALRYLGADAPALSDADGFVDTGDIVELRGDRYHFVGRRGGIINVGGAKVHPEEVEAALNAHAGGAREPRLRAQEPDHRRAGRRRSRAARRRRRPTTATKRDILAACRAAPARAQGAAVPQLRRRLCRSPTAESWPAMDNVIVTGASRGIGLAIAARLARVGYCGDRRRARQRVRRSTRPRRAWRATASARCISRSSISTKSTRFPLSSRELRAHRGPIYGLVNNAGIGTEGLLATMANSDIEALIRLNTLSPIVLTKYVVRGMMAEGRGRVVNISSIVAATGYNGLSVYAATKAALVGFTRSLAREVGRVGVTVNAIAPGFVATEMTRGLDAPARERIAARSALRRLAEAEDVAAMAAFLMGEGGRNISGAVMTVDAGGTA